MYNGRDLVLLDKLAIGKPHVIKKREYLDGGLLQEKLRSAQARGVDVAVVEVGEGIVLDVNESIKVGFPVVVNHKTLSIEESFLTLLTMLVENDGIIVLVVDSNRNVKGVFRKSDLSKHAMISRVFMSIMLLENLAYYYASMYREGGARECVKYYNQSFDRKGDKLGRVEEVGLQPLLEYIGRVIVLEKSSGVLEFFSDINIINVKIRRVVDLRNSLAHLKLVGESRLVINQSFITEYKFVEAASRDLYLQMSGDGRFLSWFDRHFSSF